MRIVGGKFRGRRIATPKPGSTEIRPTTDRARESLFNILGHGYAEKLDGSRVLDLFSGTGALGFEAISRGAAFVLFIDMGAQGRALVRETIHDLGLQGVAKLFRRDATKLGDIGTMEPFDLVFADPPYAKRLGEAALNALQMGGWLKDDALIVLEEASNAPFIMPNGYNLMDERRAGDTILRFIKRQSDM